MMSKDTIFILTFFIPLLICIGCNPTYTETYLIHNKSVFNIGIKYEITISADSSSYDTLFVNSNIKETLKVVTAEGRIGDAPNVCLSPYPNMSVFFPDTSGIAIINKGINTMTNWGVEKDKKNHNINCKFCLFDEEIQ